VAIVTGAKRIVVVNQCRGDHFGRYRAHNRVAKQVIDMFKRYA